METVQNESSIVNDGDAAARGRGGHISGAAADVDRRGSHFLAAAKLGRGGMGER